MYVQRREGTTVEPHWVPGCPDRGNRAPGSPQRVHGSSIRRKTGQWDSIVLFQLFGVICTQKNKTTNVFALTLHMCDLDCDPFGDPVRDPVRPHCVPLHAQDEARIYNHTQRHLPLAESLSTI